MSARWLARNDIELTREILPTCQLQVTEPGEKGKVMRKAIRVSIMLLLAVFTGLAATSVRADEVTVWNRILFRAALQATPPTSPLVMGRNTALVQAAVFDAINGIARQYAPVHVNPAGPRRGSQRAAAVQAAYAILLQLYPSQQATFDQERAASLAAIACSPAVRHHHVSIAKGIEWGQTVADEIWNWRSTDGFTPSPPPFLGGNDVGEWRPTPPGLLPGAGPQFAYMTPWVIVTPSQFRPLGPPPLDSDRYTVDFNETKAMGSLSSSLRTADQTLFSQFWNASTASYYWNSIAISLSAQHHPRHHSGLLQNARVLAQLDLAMADAAIACWDAKYQYVFWRPVTAIPLAATDGNPNTLEDPTWTPLLVTPAHPEYPSGHSTVSGAAATVLAHYFGRRTSFSVDSDVLPGVVRSFRSFSAALSEIRDARIFGGIHFRSACDDGQVVGKAVARYVLANSLRPIEREHEE